MGSELEAKAYRRRELGATMSDKPKPLVDPAAKKALAEERAIEGAKAMTEYKSEGEPNAPRPRT